MDNEEPCWKCQGTKVVEEPVCGWCEDGTPHASCDDTWMRKVKCDACDNDDRSDPCFVELG
jgi:hypothetical protein